MGCPWSKCCDKTDKDNDGSTQVHHQISPSQVVTIELPRKSEIVVRAQPKGSFEKECLEEHNRMRAKHGCPPLVLDRQLSNFATEWARNIACKNVMEHRPNNKYGENIYWASGKEVFGKDPVASWYDEIKDYRFGSGGFSMATGHFTQVVWKTSTKLGVGVEKKGNSTWVVANYDPPGNFSGEYENNVPVPRY